MTYTFFAVAAQKTCSRLQGNGITPALSHALLVMVSYVNKSLWIVLMNTGITYSQAFRNATLISLWTDGDDFQYSGSVLIVIDAEMNTCHRFDQHVDDIATRVMTHCQPVDQPYSFAGQEQNRSRSHH